jgi:hypothetical protein
VKLTPEEQAALLAAKGSAVFEASMRVLRGLAQGMSGDVLKYDLRSPLGDRGLALAKAEADGAQKLLAAFERFITTLKTKKDA